MAPTPRSIRFEDAVLDKLARFVMEHPGLSVSAAVNLLVAEALRMEEHPGIVFRSGPSGRRAVTVNGPDVWEIVQAVKTTRASETDASPQEIIEMVSEHSGITSQQVTTAIRYWSAYPEEIDEQIKAAEQAATAAEERWRREQGLLAS